MNLFEDGSLVIHHEGNEIGQGINTKVAQMARQVLSGAGGLAHRFGRPLSEALIRVADNSTHVVPNTAITGGSQTSDTVAFAVEDACYQLLERLKPGVAKLAKAESKGEAGPFTDPDEFWRALVKAACPGGLMVPKPKLSAIGHFGASADQLHYETYTAGVVEAEVDGLTGEYDLRYGAVLFSSGPPSTPESRSGRSRARS